MTDQILKNLQWKMVVLLCLTKNAAGSLMVFWIPSFMHVNSLQNCLSNFILNCWSITGCLSKICNIISVGACTILKKFSIKVRCYIKFFTALLQHDVDRRRIKSIQRRKVYLCEWVCLHVCACVCIQYLPLFCCSSTTTTSSWRSWGQWKSF